MSESNVVQLDEHRPHVVIEGNGRAEVLPHALLEDLADGRRRFSELEAGEELAQSLAHELLIRMGSRESQAEAPDGD